MALDSHFVLAPSLQMYFVDKDTGLPLSNGKVYFYIDNTAVLKPVYEISGTPPDFTYTPLPNPVTLSSVGTFQDGSGNDVLPYYFPFDGTTEEPGDIELYTVKVYDENAVLQFTRTGWPNYSAANVTADQDITNFVPNGQFLVHNNPASSGNLNGTQVVSQLNYGAPVGNLEVYQIAPGGWTYERNQGSVATDSVTFNAYQSVTSPTGNPKFAVRISTSGGSDSVKDLCLKFRGVNTFAGNLPFNLYFEGGSTSGGTVTLQCIIRKYFGVGGSATTESIQDSTIVLPISTISSFNVTLNFGLNTNKTVGTGGDDFVQVLLRLPPTSTQTVLLTDFAITLNDEILESFPAQTENQQVGAATAGALNFPSPDGTNLFLPVVLTPTGFGYDTAQIGNIVPAGNLSNFSSGICTNGNLLLANGAGYVNSQFSSLGIPYSRLGAYYLAGGSGNVPQYGTGPNFATGYIVAGGTTKILFTLNKTGSQTAPANGAVSPGFTFTSLSSGATDFTFTSFSNGSATIVMTDKAVGVHNAVYTAVATDIPGATVATIIDAATEHTIYTATFPVAASFANPGNPGYVLDFTSVTTGYRLWFRITTETDPGAGVPARTRAEVVLDAVMTAADVAREIANAVSTFQQYEITCVAAAGMMQSSYFTFSANSQVYVVWFNKDGGGVQPVVANAIYIPVAIANADSADTVASKTQLAINSYSFAVPNLIGCELRGYDPTGAVDSNYLSRVSYSNTLTGGNPGTFQVRGVGAGTAVSIPNNSSVAWAVRY